MILGQLVAFMQMDLLLFLSVLVLMLLLRHCDDGSGGGGRRVCKSFPKSENQSHVVPNNETVTCESGDYCFGIWKQTSDGAFHRDKQGCWPSRNVLSCVSTCVETSSESHPFYSCCCNTDMCNANPPEVPNIIQVPTHGLHSGIICLIVILVISILLGLGLLIMSPGVREQVKACYHSHSAAPVVGEERFINTELIEVIGHGRFGIVWKGLQADRPVAVKLFSAINHQHYTNEKSFHSLPLMEHGNIVKFINAGERNHNGNMDYLLITEYYPGGSLHSYLTEHNSDWRDTLKLAHSLTTGLSFLHTEIWWSGFHKPVIVHRDLTSHNILVKEDGSCAIGDFGVATAMTRHNMETHKTACIYTVGTHRYMAPEILDGSINLQDCETTLKQTDVYSLALILWEIFMKCIDLFPGGTTPDFQAAFEAEVGSNPTFEQMVTTVAKRRQRPKFPPNWKESNMGVLETIEDCWDHDSDARLTAQCAEQRISNLAAPLHQEGSN
ncbi:bone morphogenetic protein receptor type-2-like [Heptranchias perlo]|uniref:bone morphogenetic protein receptor type-2-like n=1 Tax=Heptranchias perlo TaxID=212740 RepID=UPI0035595937